MNELIERLRAMCGDHLIAKPLDAIGLIYDAANALAAADERVEELEADLDAARSDVTFYKQAAHSQKETVDNWVKNGVENSRKAKRILELEALVEVQRKENLNLREEAKTRWSDKQRLLGNAEAEYHKLKAEHDILRSAMDNEVDKWLSAKFIEALDPRNERRVTWSIGRNEPGECFVPHAG